MLFFGLAALILDRRRQPAAGLPVELDARGIVGVNRAELDRVGLAGDAQPKIVERKAAHDDQGLAAFGAGFMDVLVEDAALGGEGVFLPLLLDMDERPLPLAERHVLEAGEGEEVVFGVHTIRRMHSRRGRSDPI